MKKSIKFFIKRELLVKDKSVKKLTREYLTKAKNNLTTLKILLEIQENKSIRKELNIPKNYSTYEWVAIIGYYAMYTAARALLSKIGYRSKNHSATIILLEEYFVKKNN